MPTSQPETEFVNVANAAGSFEARRRQAMFLPNAESHVTVPFRQAMISAFFVGTLSMSASSIVAYVIMNMESIPRSMRFGFWESVATGAVIGLHAFLLTGWLQWGDRRIEFMNALWKDEEVYQEDAPPAREETDDGTRYFKVEFQASGKQLLLTDIPYDPNKEHLLIEFFKGVHTNLATAGAAGVTFTEEGARQCGYSVRRFRELKNHWLDLNLAVKKNPDSLTSAVVLTRRARSLIESILSQWGSIGQGGRR